MHTTNYFNTLIEIAEDCPAETGSMPPERGNKPSVANLQFSMLYENPYQYTSDEVLFSVYAMRKEFQPGEMDDQREHYFSKGQPCFRASPLTKRYGWGIHSDGEGRIAMYAVESEKYKELQADSTIAKVKAMRSKRK